jgi:hypothetical protein
MESRPRIGRVNSTTALADNSRAYDSTVHIDSPVIAPGAVNAGAGQALTPDSNRSSADDADVTF